MRGQLRVGAAREQQVDHRAMAAAGRAQQRGAALVVDGIDRQAEVEQAAHGIGVADDRRGRHVVGEQRAVRQRPAAPVEPVGEVAAARRQRDAERRLAIGGEQVRRRALRDQPLQHRLAAERGGQVQRAHAVAVARIEVDADREQALDQSRPAQPHRQRQRRVAGGGGGERVGAAFEQVQRAGFESARGVVAGRAGAEEAREPAAAGGRHAARAAAPQRRQRRARRGRAAANSGVSPRRVADRRDRRLARAATRSVSAAAALSASCSSAPSSAGAQQLGEAGEVVGGPSLRPSRSSAAGARSGSGASPSSASLTLDGNG